MIEDALNIIGGRDEVSLLPPLRCKTCILKAFDICATFHGSILGTSTPFVSKCKFITLNHQDINLAGNGLRSVKQII